MLSLSQVPPSNLTICAPACIKRVLACSVSSALEKLMKGKSETINEWGLALATHSVW